MKNFLVTWAEFLVVRELNESKLLLAFFLPSWKRKSKIISEIDHISPFTSLFHESFTVIIDGSDEATEYIISVLHLNDVPAMALFLGKQILYKSDISSKVKEYDLSFLTCLSAASLNSSNISVGHASLITSTIFLESHVTLGPVFVAGDKSQVGKSTICLGILANLIKLGFHPSQLAYIKPVTQCEAEQPITRYCTRMGISCHGIGPIVFYKGFTRAFLNNDTDSTTNLLKQVVNSVKEISKGKVITIVDGVGYPSVGSIVGLSNGHVAQALKCPVLMIGKPGVGDAVDSYNLNATYFESFGVQILGAVFNKLPEEGYYNLNDCRISITQYFNLYRPSHRIYGFIPLVSKQLKEEASMILAENVDFHSHRTETDSFENACIEVFSANFEVHHFLYDIFCAKLSATINLSPANPYVEYASNLSNNQPEYQNQSRRINSVKINDEDSKLRQSRKRSRDEIENDALSKGAKGG